MKTALITGGAGFIGSHLCEKYLQDGFRVISIDNYSTGSQENTRFLESSAKGSECFRSIHADVSEDWGPWIKTLPAGWLDHLQYIFYFSSPASPSRYQSLNVETMMANSIGLKQALDFARSHQARLIFASTSEIYGSAQIHPQSEDYWGHANSFGERSCYNEAKRFGEALIYSYNKKHGTKNGLVRIFNTYGPRMDLADGRVVINVLSRILLNQNAVIHGDGSQTRSFCYISDLIEGVWKYAQSELCEPVNLGNPEEIKISALVQTIYELFPDKQKKISYLPRSAEDPLLRRPDIGKARQLLNWEPQIALSQGLIQMKKWLEKRP